MLDNGQTVGKDYWVCRAVRTAYLRNPPKPRYNKFWDIRLVFALFKRWGPNENLTLEQISKKFVLLFLLVSGQRGQAVGALSLDQLVWSDKGEAVFTLTKLMKTARTGVALMSITLEPYPKDKDLCMVELLKSYSSVTERHRGSSRQLVLSYKAPFHAVGRDTVSRWVVRTLEVAGIDVNKYKSHSTRGAGTSAAVSLGITANVLLKYGSWKSEKSMARHYRKPVEKAPKTSLATAILNMAE